jgi:hypothetical protein
MSRAKRKLDRKALVRDGTPSAQAARARTQAAKRTFRRMDAAMDELRACVEGWTTGKDMALRNGEALTDMADLMDELWKEVSEADFYLGQHIDNDRPHSLAADEAMRISKVYPDEPAWKPSKDLCCPACGDLLVVGPAPGDLYCPYCRRLVGSSERRPVQSGEAYMLFK